MLANALGSGVKEIVSLALYVFGAAFALCEPIVSLATYVAVALVWLVPDRRIVRTMAR